MSCLAHSRCCLSGCSEWRLWPRGQGGGISHYTLILCLPILTAGSPGTRTRQMARLHLSAPSLALVAQNTPHRLVKNCPPSPRSWSKRARCKTTSLNAFPLTSLPKLPSAQDGAKRPLVAAAEPACKLLVLEVSRPPLGTTFKRGGGMLCRKLHMSACSATPLSTPVAAASPTYCPSGA